MQEPEKYFGWRIKKIGALPRFNIFKAFSFLNLALCWYVYQLILFRISLFCLDFNKQAAHNIPLQKAVRSDARAASSGTEPESHT